MRHHLTAETEPAYVCLKSSMSLSRSVCLNRRRMRMRTNSSVQSRVAQPLHQRDRPCHLPPSPPPLAPSVSLPSTPSGKDGVLSSLLPNLSTTPPSTALYSHYLHTLTQHPGPNPTLIHYLFTARKLHPLIKGQIAPCPQDMSRGWAGVL